MHDIYDGRRDRLAEFCDAVQLRDGQSGALALVAGRPAVLDHVSRPEVFAALHAPLVQGYALDALEARDDAPTDVSEAAVSFLRRVLEARISEHDGIGHGDELIQLTAFPDQEQDITPDGLPTVRIRRPSRRRAA